jgi:predicted transglutaminase-like protease
MVPYLIGVTSLPFSQDVSYLKLHCLLKLHDASHPLFHIQSCSYILLVRSVDSFDQSHAIILQYGNIWSTQFVINLVNKFQCPPFPVKLIFLLDSLVVPGSLSSISVCSISETIASA